MVHLPRSSVATSRAQHGDPVADLGDLVHAVRDEDDPRSLRAQASDDLEEAVAGGDVERRRGLVEDKDLGVAHQRAHDAAGLPIAERELLDGGVEVDRPVEQLFERRPRPRSLVPHGHASPQ